MEPEAPGDLGGNQAQERVAQAGDDQAEDGAHPGRILFVWSVREQAGAVYLEEIQALAARLPGLRFHLHVTASDGLLTAEGLEALAVEGTLGQRRILLCGPPPMMRALTAQCAARGVRRGRIVSEEFVLR